MKYKITERYIYAYIMALLGGFMGGYSYITRGGVFASAQTGNLIKLGIKITEANFDAWYLFIFPIIMFIVGIMVCEFMKNEVAEGKLIHWKQWVLVIEGIIFLIVAFMPLGRLDVYANMLIGFAAGMQTQTIRVVEGTVMMTTMLTGNTRTMAELLYYAIREKSTDKLKVVLKQLGVILSFIAGVIVSGFVCKTLHHQAILFAFVFLIAAHVLIMVNKENI